MSPMLASVAARIRGSVWTGPVLKLVLVLVGLLVLAGIGHTVTATAAVGGPVPPTAVAASASASSAPVDAGAADVQVEAEASAPVVPVVHAPRATPDDPVFLNEATVTDLRRLPGIGEKRAQAILELRAKLGRFKQIEELLRVRGIGRATLKKLRPLVRVERPDGG